MKQQPQVVGYRWATASAADAVTVRLVNHLGQWLVVVDAFDGVVQRSQAAALTPEAAEALAAQLTAASAVAKGAG